MKMILPALMCLLLLSPITPARAWGPHSHELVAEIAARNLDPQVRREVEELLGDRADLGMRSVSSWADHVRDQPEYRDTGPLHYINFTRDSCVYDARRNCRGGRCIVEALSRQVKLLADRSRSKAQRAESLAFVIHFVGDIHQPLHAGWFDDRGGNDLQLRVGRKGMNLHALWDDFLARQAGLRVREHADKLLAAPLTRTPIGWDRTMPVAWALESCQVIALGVYPPSSNVDRAWLQRMLPLAEDRIEIAGLRLAALLNAELGPKRRSKAP